MDLSQFEYILRHIRGRNVGFYAGDKALSADEAAALLAAHEKAYGPGLRPGYVSPDGWQVLEVAKHKPAAKVDKAEKAPKD